MATTFDLHQNGGYGIITNSPGLAGTSLTLSVGDLANFPTPTGTGYNAIVFPNGVAFKKSNGEALRVTAKGAGLTATRAQEGSSAIDIQSGYQIAFGATAKVFTDIEAALNTAENAIVVNTAGIAANVATLAALGLWSAYTPVVVQSGTLSGAELTITSARYTQIGKTVRVTVVIVIANGADAVGGNSITISLPVAAASATGAPFIGTGDIFDTSASAIFSGHVFLATTTTVSLLGFSSTNTLGAGGFTAALAVGDSIKFECEYEAA